jgi:hypothetical protein
VAVSRQIDSLSTDSAVKVTHSEAGAEEREAERQQFLAFRLGGLLVLLGVDHRQTAAGQVEAGRPVAHVCTSLGTEASTRRRIDLPRWRHFSPSKPSEQIVGKTSKLVRTTSARSRSGGRKRTSRNQSERTQQNSKVGRSFKLHLESTRRTGLRFITENPTD